MAVLHRFSEIKRLYQIGKLANTQHTTDVWKAWSTPFRYIRCYGPNRRISPGTGQPGDPGIPSIYLFLRNILVSQIIIWIKTGSIILSTDDGLRSINRINILHMRNVP
jgi:hypothetical protein